jgi:outer membrane protein assembly factor BamB
MIRSKNLISINGRFAGRLLVFLLFVTLSALGFSQTAQSVVMTPATVYIGSSSTGTVTLSSAAPTGGAVVSLLSNNTLVTVPSTVTVAADATSATFTATTKASTSSYSASITASYGGGNASAELTVEPTKLSAFSISPTTFIAGTSTQGTVTLAKPAPAGGWVVTLTSSQPSLAIPPATVTVAAGSSSATFTVTTVHHSTFGANIIASDPVSAIKVSFTVYGAKLSSLSLTPTQPYGGQSVMATVTLANSAPTPGWTVNFSSSQPSLVGVPASVTVAPGATTATFTVTTTAHAGDYSCKITATDTDSTVAASLSVQTYAISNLSISPMSLTGGTSSTGTITLTNPAPSNGWSVTLKSANPSEVSVPASIVVASGQSTATFPITTLPTTKSISNAISATDSITSKAVALSVAAESLTSVVVNPSSLTGGTSSQGTVTLESTAPTGGWTVNLSSSSTNATVPSSVVVPAGTSTATFAIATTLPATTVTAVITGTDQFTKSSANLTVQGPLPASVVVAPSILMYPQTSTGTVTLSIAAPTGGAVVSLMSNASSITVPATVTVAAGSKTATFAITTSSVSSTTTATITATINGTSASAAMTQRVTLVDFASLTGGEVYSTPVIGGLGQVLVGSGSGVFYSLNPTGTVSWSYTTGGAVNSSPVLDSSGNVYVGSSDGNLYGFTAKGQLLWKTALGAPVISSPKYFGGNLYVAAGTSVYSVSTSGVVNWKYTDTTTGIFVSSPAVGTDGTVYIGGDDFNVYALTSTGTLKWTYPTNGEVESSPTLGSDGTVYIGSDDDNLYALTSAGTLKWSFLTNGTVQSSPLLGSDGTVYVGSGDDHLYAVNSNGSMKWSYLTGGAVVSSPKINSNGTIYFGSNDDYMYAVNTSGILVWHYLTKGAVQSSVGFDSSGNVYIGSDDDNVYAFFP